MISGNPHHVHEWFIHIKKGSDSVSKKLSTVELASRSCAHYSMYRLLLAAKRCVTVSRKKSLNTIIALEGQCSACVQTPTSRATSGNKRLIDLPTRTVLREWYESIVWNYFYIPYPPALSHGAFFVAHSGFSLPWRLVAAARCLSPKLTLVMFFKLQSNARWVCIHFYEFLAFYTYELLIVCVSI